MNFIADESVDAPVVRLLRENGHAVECVWEYGAGLPDDEVLRRANQNGAVLITADRDIGELVFRLGQAHHGVLLVRLAGVAPTLKAAIVADAVAQHGDDMNGAFSVVSPGVVRIRREVR